MKQIKILFIALIVMSCMPSFSQSKQIALDPRLREVFSDAKLNSLQSKAPDKIEYYNFYLNNYCSLEVSAPVNGIYKGDISEIKANEGSNWVIDSNSFDIKSFNMLKFHIPLEIEKKIYYSMGSSNTFLVFISINEFSNIRKLQNISK